MSWYYYLEGKVTFPFRARCAAANAVSPLRQGETVEVLRMAVEDACEHDMLVQIRWQGRKMAVSLSQLEAINPDESTQEALGDWHYWLAHGYCLLFTHGCLKLTMMKEFLRAEPWESSAACSRATC